MHFERKRLRLPAAVLSVATCLAVPAQATANIPPTAVADSYDAGANATLSVDAPGVLENDEDVDNDPLTAVLDQDPAPGAFLELFSDGSFEYTPPVGFIGTDTFSYTAHDGLAGSDPATVTITVAPSAGITVHTDEATFLDHLATLGISPAFEGFEDDACWGTSRTPLTAPSVLCSGVSWSANNPSSGVTTGGGPARTGAWGFFTLPHGSYATGSGCDVPGACGDGFRGTTGPALVAVGGWITGTWGGKVELVLDGQPVDFGDNDWVDASHRFFGVVDTGGFSSFEFNELEGKLEDQKFIFADDFALGWALDSLFADGFESGDTARW